MVRALPSDLARLVLDYLYTEGLQNSYDVFLQESPHLEELRSFSSTGILPLGAKNLQAIVEEYYELVAQDSGNVKNTNDALYKLWRRCDALLIQIKHHYGVSTSMAGDMVSQSVRSRYSLNRLHHERLQMERDQVLQGNRANQPSRQQGQLTLPHRQQSQQQGRPQPVQFVQPHVLGGQVLHQQVHSPQQHQVHSPQIQLQPQEQLLPQQVQQQQVTVAQSFPTSNNQAGEQVVVVPVRTSTPRAASPVHEEIASPQESVSSTQSQFTTPHKSSQSASDKVVGKSPKRKSAPPRRKVAPGSSYDRLQHNLPSTSAGVGFMDDIQDLPSPWGSVFNNQELVAKLAENINRMLPTQPMGTDEVDEGALTDHRDQGNHSSSSPQNLDDILGTVSDTVMEEFVDMTSSDPAFQSLFSLFNTDRDKFLNSERKKLSLSYSEGDLNSSGESGEGSVAHPDSTGNMPPPDVPSQSLGEAFVQTVHNHAAKTASMPGSHQEAVGPTTDRWPLGVLEQNMESAGASSSAGAASQNSGEAEVQSSFPNMVVSRTSAIDSRLQDKHEPVAGSSGTIPGQPSGPIPATSGEAEVQSTFPNMVVSRTSAIDSRLQDEHELVAGSSGTIPGQSSGPIPATSGIISGKSLGSAPAPSSGTICGPPATSNVPGSSRTEKVLKARADSPQVSKDAVRTSKMIVKSISDFQHVRVLSFDGGAGTSNEQGASRTPQGNLHSASSNLKSRSGSSGRRDGHVHPERDLGALKNNNDRTPSKRQVCQSPLRIYSPKEKIVAKLLTKLPTTPTKTPQFQMVETLSPSTLGGRKVYVITRKKSGASPANTPSKITAKKAQVGSVIQSDASGHLGNDKTGAVTGTQVSDMPGHSKDSRPNVHENRLLGHPNTEQPNSQDTVSGQPLSTGHSKASGQPTASDGVASIVSKGKGEERPAKAPSEDGGKMPAKKGVKRERKAGEKTKASKKSKQGKVKSLPNMVFPDNLDVDKFLSQIHNE